MGAIACMACGAMVGEGLDECPSCGANPKTGLWGAPAPTAIQTGVSRGGRPEGAFATALTLYMRNIVWLALAGVIAAVIEIAIAAAVSEIAASMGYAAVRRIAAGSSASVKGYTTGITVLAMAGTLVSQLVLLVLRGGLFKMAIDSEREGHSARLETLFAGFPRFLSYAGLWAAMAVVAAAVWGIAAVCALLLGPLVIPVAIAGGILLLYLYVTWVYALPLVADRKLGPLEALSRSSDMVRNAGWWATFAPFFVLGLLLLVVMFVLAQSGVYLSAGSGHVTYAVMEIVFMPFVVCLVAAMYLGSEPRRARPAVDSPIAQAPVAPRSAPVVSPAQASPAAGASRPAAAPIAADAARIAAAAAAWAATAKPVAAPEAGSPEH